MYFLERDDISTRLANISTIDSVLLIYRLFENVKENKVHSHDVHV